MRTRFYDSLPLKGVAPFGFYYNHLRGSFLNVPLNEEKDFAPFIRNLQTSSYKKRLAVKKSLVESFVQRIWGAHLSTVEPVIQSLPDHGIDEFIVNYVLHSAKLIQVICDFMTCMNVDSNKKLAEFPFLKPSSYTALLNRDFGVYSVDLAEYVVASIKAYCENLQIDFHVDCGELPFMDRRSSELALIEELKLIKDLPKEGLHKELGLSALCFSRMCDSENYIRRCNRIKIELALHNFSKIAG